MTQPEDQMQKAAEWNALFLALNEQGQESALHLLCSLKSVQSASSLPKNSHTPPTEHTA